MINPERNLEAKELEPKTGELVFGIAVSNLANPYNPEAPIPTNLYPLSRKVATYNQGIDIQLEGDLTIDEEIRPSPELPFVSTHLPIINVDLLEEGEKLDSGYEILRNGFRVARQVDADQAVLHLQSSKLDWETLDKRETNIENLKEEFIKIVKLAEDEDFKGKLLLENLEYPLFPATSEELKDVAQFIDEVSEKTMIELGICIDLGHLWHSGLLIRENAWREELQDNPDSFARGISGFSDYLDSTINDLGDRIKSFHIAGGEITRSDHFTHLNPHITVNQNPDSDLHSLDLPASLQLIHNFAASSNDKIPVINEAHEASYRDMVHANESLEGFLEFAYPKTSPEYHQVNNLEEFYNDPRVRESQINFLGGEEDNWQDAKIKHAYVGIGYLDKLHRGKKSPLSTTEAKYVGDWINSHNGELEVHASLLPSSRETEDFPSRSLLIWDLDRYRMTPNSPDGHMKDDNTPMFTPYDTYTALEPVIDLYLETFDRFGIPVMTTLTGKGIHFISQVTDYELLKQIQEIGGPVEDTLRGKLDISDRFTKSHRPIPEAYQQIHVGTGRLQQFVNTMLINRARALLYPYYEAELFAKAKPQEETNAFAFDNAAVAFPVYHKNISIPGSPNLIKAFKTGVDDLPISIQIPITGNGFRYNWKDVVHNRDDLTAAANYLGSVDSHVPIANNLDAMLEQYNNSELKNLHLAMDSSMGDHADTFSYGYRKDNYEGIVSLSKNREDIRNIIDYAPEYFGNFPNFHAFDQLIFEVYEGMGGSRTNLAPAPHVAGFMRALFEDPYKNWSDRWTGKMDAATYTRKMVEQVLGQMFE